MHEHTAAPCVSLYPTPCRRLDNNSLSGTIPDNIGGARSLRSLYVWWFPQIEANRSVIAAWVLRYGTRCNLQIRVVVEMGVR